MNLIAFDTETCGLPNWKEPSEHPDQPHMVELSAALVDSDTRDIIERVDVLIRPDGWVIPEDMTAIHGITHEQAMAEGIPEAEALDRFLALYAKAQRRVAHNATFDDRIIRIAIKRYRDEETAEAFKTGTEKFCTCWESKALCNIPGKKGAKLPTLGEAYQHFTGQPYLDAHRAGPDMEACLAVYFGIQDAGKTVAPAPAISADTPIALY